MTRKRWTPQIEVTDALIRFREKRKWQLSYRRYVLEGKPSEAYARYFGLSSQVLRQWFELQFTADLHWENFGKAWQFDHIVPAAYFDFASEEDLLLCWSFINMRVEKIDTDNTKGNRIDALAIRPYFEGLYARTGYSLCIKMLEKIKTIETSCIKNSNAGMEDFINQNKAMLEKIASFSNEDFIKLNGGMSVDEIILEREILRKFG